MAADTMEALGIARGSYVVKVNNRKVLDGVLEAIGLGGDENAARRLTVLRAIDKLDKFRLDEVRSCSADGTAANEGKGDFTKGAGLEPAQMRRIVACCHAKQRRLARCGRGGAMLIWPSSETGKAGVSELRRDRQACRGVRLWR